MSMTGQDDCGNAKGRVSGGYERERSAGVGTGGEILVNRSEVKLSTGDWCLKKLKEAATRRDRGSARDLTACGKCDESDRHKANEG